jgi:hypothetical protein
MNSSTNICRLVSAFACIVIIAPTSLQAEEWRWKLAAGDKLKVDSAQTIVSETQYSGKSIKSTTDLAIGVLWTVDSVEDDKINLTQQVQSIKVGLVSDRETLEFDSAAKEKPKGAARQLQAALAPLLGVKLQSVMTTRGELVSSELPEDSKADEATADAVRYRAWGAALKKMGRQTLLLLPPGEVMAGDDWKHEVTGSEALGSFTRTTTYRLKAIEDGVAVVEQSVELDLSDPKRNLKVLENSATGEAKFSIDDGAVLSSDWRMKIKTENPYRETGISVVAETTLKTTIERLK